MSFEQKARGKVPEANGCSGPWIITRPPNPAQQNKAPPQNLRRESTMSWLAGWRNSFSCGLGWLAWHGTALHLALAESLAAWSFVWVEAGARNHGPCMEAY